MATPGQNNESALIVADTYRLESRIYSGSFGEIRIGVNTTTGMRVAAKLEPLTSKLQLLPIEYNVYLKLKGEPGIPSIYYYGQCGKFNVLVMNQLGLNLEQVFNLCKRQFTLKTILYLAIQLTTRIETIHRHGFLFRDIKPENFLLGSEPDSNLIYMINFGLSKPYIDPATSHHIKIRERRHYTGCVRYMSINSHHGLQESRRDDLESLAYVLLYFLRQGKLPWSGFRGLSIKERYNKILEYKYSIPIETLCHGFPREFSNFLRYSRSLAFEATPNYKQVQEMFEYLFAKESFRDDGVYDWSNRTSAADQS